MDRIIAKTVGVYKQYRMGNELITALTPTSIELNNDELVMFMGPSGSGKTTLLSLLGGVIYPSGGDVIINNISLLGKKDQEIARIRLQNIGFIFQSYNLIAPLTAIENVLFPLQLLNMEKDEAYTLAQQQLEKVNMSSNMHKLPRQLSGGEQQRVAIARAMVTNPPMLLCDEPTAALDSKTGELVMQQLKALSKQGHGVVVVTHDQRLTVYADRIMNLEDGTLYEKRNNN